MGFSGRHRGPHPPYPKLELSRPRTQASSRNRRHSNNSNNRNGKRKHGCPLPGALAPFRDSGHKELSPYRRELLLCPACPAAATARFFIDDKGAPSGPCLGAHGGPARPPITPALCALTATLGRRYKLKHPNSYHKIHS